jgi:hypothetical protein
LALERLQPIDVTLPEVRVAVVAGDTLLKFFFGEMLDKLREDGASRVHASLFHPSTGGKTSIQPFSVQIVPASTTRYRLIFNKFRPTARNFAGQ